MASQRRTQRSRADDSRPGRRLSVNSGEVIPAAAVDFVQRGRAAQRDASSRD